MGHSIFDVTITPWSFIVDWVTIPKGAYAACFNWFACSGNIGIIQPFDNSFDK